MKEEEKLDDGGKATLPLAFIKQKVLPGGQTLREAALRVSDCARFS